MSIHIGTAPDSWGVWLPSDPRQTPWQRFLDEVAEADYPAIELGPFGYLPTEPQRVRDELSQRHLELAGGTISGDLSTPDGWQSMCATAASICDVLEALGARFLVVLDSGQTTSNHTRPGPGVLDGAAWGRLRDTVHRLGEYTARRGIAAVFHPHADTTIQFEADIERLLELTDPSLVNLCLDVGHHAYAGGDPIRFFLDHHGRIPYLHLKDVDRAIAERALAEGWGMGRAVTEGAFVDLGQGDVDFPSLNRAVADVGFDGWGIVEQDMFPAPFERPLPIARRNRRYLRATGIG